MKEDIKNIFYISNSDTDILVVDEIHLISPKFQCETSQLLF